MSYTRFLTAVAVAGGLMFAIPAQGTAQEVPVPQEQVEVTDELVDRFVAVYPAVVEVAQTAQAELSTADTPEQAHAIQVEAQEQMTVILDEGDLTAEQYEAVVTRLNDDPALLAEVQERLQAESEGGTGG